MIPLEYLLRQSVRLEPQTGGTWRVVCRSPLNVLLVNEAAARLLDHCRRGASVSTLAAVLGLDEERVLTLCEHFRSRGILEVGRPILDPSYTPSVTVIVPTRDRAQDLDECLEALRRLDYPGEQLDLIVVDDGSAYPRAVAEVAGRHGARLIVNERNRGQSYSRNRAADAATDKTATEILAFIDSDCVASPYWLRDLTPYFVWDRVGAVGGRTAGYFTESRLDRYEQVASPLDMGPHLLMEEAGPATFYVPTCNMLVRRSVFTGLHGLREDLTVGEDVDLCWRLRAQGHYLIYAAAGVVRHKHRSQFGPLLRRRAEYGASEASLYSLHPDKRKHLPWAPAPLATLALLSAGVVGRRPALAVTAALPLLHDAARRFRHLREKKSEQPAGRVLLSVARGHLSMLYFVYFHLVRYYLVLLAVAGMISRGTWRLGALAAVYAGTVDYATRRPRLAYPTYLGCYLAEHIAYQVGVIAGCVRAETFRSYLLTLQRPTLRRTP